MTKADHVVFFYDDGLVIDRGQGIFSRPLAREEKGATQMLTGMSDIPPGGVIPLHTHSDEEFVLVLTGHATVRIGEESYEVAPMDGTFIHPNVVHQYENTGDDILRILWVYGTVASTRTLIGTGETLGHLDRYPDRS